MITNVSLNSQPVIQPLDALSAQRIQQCPRTPTLVPCGIVTFTRLLFCVRGTNAW
jgi:hypothetical protein